MSKFIVVEHFARRAGHHFDLRFQIGKDKYDSFAFRKGVPLKHGIRTLAVRTKIHTEKEAFFTGEIEQGYGAGHLEIFDEGVCDIQVYKDNYIRIVFNGKKVKGLYHFINLPKMKKGTFIVFKSSES